MTPLRHYRQMKPRPPVWLVKGVGRVAIATGVQQGDAFSVGLKVLSDDLDTFDDLSEVYLDQREPRAQGERKEQSWNL